MPIQTTRALILSAFYGLLVVLAALPIIVMATATAGVLGVISMGAPLLLGIFVLVLLAAVFAQCARYSASVTGLQSIAQQPSFVNSVLGGLSATFIVSALAVGVGAGVLILRQEPGAASPFGSLDTKEILLALKAYAETPATTERTVSLAGMSANSTFFTVLAISMVFVTLVSMLVVPRAAGLDDGYRRAYSKGALLTRLTIAVPFCGLVALIIVNMFISAVEGLAGVFAPDFVAPVFVLYVLEMFIFTGMIFTFEAQILSIGREVGEAEQIREREIERADTSEIRALRQAWSGRA